MKMKVLLLITALWITGCDSESRPAPLPTTKMQLGSANFDIEIANQDKTREHGLMQRDSMPMNHGMIFVFPAERPQAFWMKNTRIPLDIVYIDRDGKVVSIKQMKAYDLSTTPSDYPVKYAIELNLGVASQAGVKVGDHVDIPPEAKEAKE